jgi:hypothetical protein
VGSSDDIPASMMTVGLSNGRSSLERVASSTPSFLISTTSA